MPEMMGLEMLQEQLKDVVSHEFFHIVTPLTIHSNEIKYFDFNNPQNVRTFMDVKELPNILLTYSK